MAEIDLSSIVQRVNASIEPHLKTIVSSTETFRKTSEAHNSNVRNVIKDVYDNIVSNQKDISDISSSIDATNSYLQSHTRKIDSVNFLLNQSIQMQYLMNKNLVSLNKSIEFLSQTITANFIKTNKNLNVGISSIDNNLTTRMKQFFATPTTTAGKIGRIAGVAAGAVAAGATAAGVSKAIDIQKSLPKTPDMGTPSQRGSRMGGPSETTIPPPPPSSETGAPSTGGTTAPSAPTGNVEPKKHLGGLTGNYALDRKNAFGKELEDKNIIARLYNTAKAEVGANPREQQLFIEGVLNRAMFSNKTISSILNPAYGYGSAARNTSINEENYNKFIKGALATVMAGSNDTKSATENASNAPGNPLADNRLHRDKATGMWSGGQRNKGEFHYNLGPNSRIPTSFGLKAHNYQQNLERELAKEKEKGKEEKDATPAPAPRTQSSADAIPNPIDPNLPGGVSAERQKGPFENVLLHQSGFSGKPSWEEALRLHQGGAGDIRGKTFGYHYALKSLFVDKNGKSIDEKQYDKLSDAEKQNYTEMPQMHELRSLERRPNQAQGGYNQSSLGFVTLGKTTQSKIDYYNEFLANMVAKGQLSEDVLKKRSVSGHGEIQPDSVRASLDRDPETGKKVPEGQPVAERIRRQTDYILNRAKELKKQLEQQQSQQQKPAETPKAPEGDVQNYLSPSSTNMPAAIPAPANMDTSSTKYIDEQAKAKEIQSYTAQDAGSTDNQQIVETNAPSQSAVNPLGETIDDFYRDSEWSDVLANFSGQPKANWDQPSSAFK